MGAKLLIEARDIQVTYALRRVLDVERFELYDGDRVGLVGENGAGKSTLLKVLSGELSPDAGWVRRLCEVSEISQLGDTSASDEDMDARLKSEFQTKEKREGLSGGERTRRRIAGALTGRCHALLADEPTVDLDADGVRALEKRLKAYEGAVVLVSHDRTLLDNVCTRILALTDGKLTEYPGNYSDYRRERERQLQFERDEYDAYRAEQARIKTMIQREVEYAGQKQHLPTRMGNSEARLHKREVTNTQGKIHQVRKSFESRLERLPEKRRPREDVSIKMALGASQGVVSRIAVEARGLTLAFGDRTLIKNASFSIPARTRTALIGENGCGKTTLLKTILRGEAPVRVSPGVSVGYFGQEHEEVLDMNESALNNVMKTSVHDESAARTVLARLNIRGDDVYKPARVLSGGERAKISMARLFVSSANALILDEPTNHLDIFSLEALEGVLREYQGTLILVSHDQRFVEGVANRLIFFENQTLVTFEGDMAAYREYRAKADKARGAEDARIEITTLEMSLAALAARMSAPKKGESSEALAEEYMALAQRIREAKAKL